jgi:chorismate mutase/prephenate dehydratase
VSEDLEQLRRRIASTDAEILELVNRRLQLVGEIRELKQANGVAFVDPQQEERLVQRLRELNGGPLSEEGVDRLFAEILALVKDELSGSGA